MKLRPHHLLDIISAHGRGVEFTPHPYGHALHIVAAQLLYDLSLEIELVIEADDICAPCRHLQPNGICNDLLPQLANPISKQAYNDELDSRLFVYLGMTPGVRVTRYEFLERVRQHLPGIEQLCTHPGEEQTMRLAGLKAGLSKLGAMSGAGECNT